LRPELLRYRDRPPTVVAPPELIDKVMDDPSRPVRYFKCYRVSSWLEETVVSLFLHFAIVGSTLYVERTSCALLPIKAEYHLIDRLTNQPLPGETGRLLGLTLKDVPASLLRAPGEFVRRWQRRRQEERSDYILQARIHEDLPIDYGARDSIRELAAADSYHNYFQELDAFRHLQAIETRVLAGIDGFLEQHGIDTGEFRARVTYIQNQGVIAHDITNSTVVGGPGAGIFTNSEHAHLAALLRALQDALAADGDQLGGTREDVAEHVAAVERELDTKQQPGRHGVVRTLLKGIAEDAKAVTSIVNAANALLTALHPHLQA